MKRLLISLVALFLLSLFNDSFAQATTKATKAVPMGMSKDYPYKPTYSASFTIGPAAYAKKVLDLWKDFDDNNFERHDYLADTVKMMFPDGSMSKGKDQNLEEVKKYRGGFTSVKSVVHAWVPLTSTDRNETVVCIWGTEEDTTPDGKVEKRDVHEVWWFNKAGKVTMMRQWAAKFGDQ